MEFGNWIILCVLIVVLTLGILALVQTSRIQKKQYKHLLINEIIDWADEIVNSIRTENVSTVGSTDPDTARKYVLNNRLFRLYGLDAKTEYMKHIATFFPELPDKLSEVQSNMNELSEVFLETVDGKEKDYGCMLDTHFIRLEISAEEVIKLALQVKDKELV